MPTSKQKIVEVRVLSEMKSEYKRRVDANNYGINLYNSQNVYCISKMHTCNDEKKRQ